MSLRIQSIVAHEVVVPAHPGIIHSPGFTGTDQAVWDEKPICLLEVFTDDGQHGLGEIVRGHTLSDLQAVLARLPGRRITPAGLEEIPNELKARPFYGVKQSMPIARWQSASPILPAIEQAALDIFGKKLKLRAVDLLGGPVRDHIAVDFWCGRQAPEDLRAWVKQAVAGGFSGIKMKSSLGDPIVRQVETIRDEAGEDFRITIDPVFQWLSPNDSLGIFHSLESMAGNSLTIEDPFPHEFPVYWQRIRQLFAIPLAWHARNFADLRHGLQSDCADCYNLTADTGSISEFITQAHALEVLGHTFWQGSTLELGVGIAARLHTAAATRACTLSCDFASPLVRENTLVDWNWPFEGGSLPIPDRPGLGVEFDAEALEKYRRKKAVFE